MNLTHYIIVRRDLPLGVIAAMVTHAAGESASLYEDDYDGRFQGATAVVLEVKDEQELVDTQVYLRKNGINAVSVEERGGVYDGQLMAIGLVPCEREDVAPLLAEYQSLKTTTYRDEEQDVCSCTNCRIRRDDELDKAGVNP